MGHYVHLGATASPSSFSLNVDELASRVAQRVSDRVTTGVDRAIDNGVTKIATSVSASVDRFVDSPTGSAVFDKIENKLNEVVVDVVKEHKVELALLGLAGLSFFMGGSNVAGKMGPRGTRVAFVTGVVALALVASGVFAPPEEKPPAPQPIRRTPAR